MDDRIKDIISERKIIWLIAFVAVLFLAMRACEYFPESSFELAKESRLPKFIETPSMYSRQDISITMNYYVKPWGRTALFIAKNPAGNVVDKIETKAQGLEPHVLKGASSGYPSYEIISVRGVTEVIEHRRIEPVFYVADDPAVLKELGIK